MERKIRICHFHRAFQQAEMFLNAQAKERRLVIPFINDGKRILCLISRIQKTDAAGKTDVIIVDGGSTDCSMES